MRCTSLASMRRLHLSQRIQHHYPHSFPLKLQISSMTVCIRVYGFKKFCPSPNNPCLKNKNNKNYIFQISQTQNNSHASPGLQATWISRAAVTGSLTHHQHVLWIGLANSTPPKVTVLVVVGCWWSVKPETQTLLGVSAGSELSGGVIYLCPDYSWFYTPNFVGWINI